jgi:NDP-sugar pyrophosphorylase family protein
MKALVLAGGRGTRLEPVVTDVPKPMATVAGRPFLEWQLEFLESHGVGDVVLSVGYRSDVIRDHFGDGSGFGVDVAYAEETEPLGTGGAVRNARDHLDEEGDFLVLNGDTYLDVDLGEFVAFHRATPGTATLALSRLEEEQKGGFVHLNGDARIERFVEERRDGGLVNGGIRAFDAAVLSRLPDETKFDLSTVCERLAADGELYGYRTEGYFKDIGTPERYREINEELEEVVG